MKKLFVLICSGMLLTLAACNNNSVDEYNLFVLNGLEDTITVKKIAPSGKSLGLGSLAPGDTCQVAHYAVEEGKPLEEVYLDAKLIFAVQGGASYQTTKADTLGPCWVKNYRLVGRRIYHFTLTQDYLNTLQ